MRGSDNLPPGDSYPLTIERTVPARLIHQAENGPCRHERLFTPEERTYLICLDSQVQHSYQVISLAQIAGSFRRRKFRPGRYQQFSCFGASGCARAGADQVRDADRRAQFPTDRSELPGRGKRAFEQAHGSPVVSQCFATQQRAVDPINLGSSPAFAGLLHQGLSRSSEASRPFYLSDSSEFRGEQNSIEWKLNATDG